MQVESGVGSRGWGKSFGVRNCDALAIDILVRQHFRWKLEYQMISKNMYVPHAVQAALRRAVGILMGSSVQMQSPSSLP
jgi:hypothetical protein